MSQRSVEDNLIVQYGNLMATTLACDCTGQFAALCGQKAITLVNLDNPNEILKTFTRNSRHRFCYVQWNPHPFRSHIFLVANSQYVELWSRDALMNSGCQKALKGHTLQVNDFDWSPIDANLAATCSADTNTCLWDVRDVRRPTTTLQSVVCPSQVKWNHLCESILATTHEGDMKIWDLRKSNTPVHYISAHERKVSGLDWSPFSDRQVATCSEDGFVKFWDITSQKPEEDQILSTAPFWKIKYMPFGNGVVTSYLPQTGGALCFWSLNKLLSHPYRRQPLCTFGSHSGEGSIIDFCWRTIDSDYQLLSWSNDQSLRLYKIDNLIRQRCGNGHYASFMISNSCESTPDREIVDPTTVSNEILVQQSSANDKMSSSSSLRRRKKGGNGPMTVQSEGGGGGSGGGGRGGGGGGGLSVENAKTLMHEFALLNVAIPDLTITEMSIETQKLTVDVVKGVHEVHMTMSFPSSYPNKVAPEFHLSEETTLERPLQQKLIEDLQSTALQHVHYNRRCIEPCLWKLVNSLDAIIESRTSPDLDPSYLPMQEIWAHYSTEKLRDENVPFPRISGARFCGPGFLVCFTRRMFLDVLPSTNIVVSEPHKRKQSESGITPRAMSALTEMTQPTRIPSAGNMMRSFMGAARSLPSDSNVPSVSQYYKLQDQRPQKSKTKPRMREHQSKPVLSRSSSTTKTKNPVGPVIVYDLSCLLPIQKLLAENYVFDEKDPVSMCRKNAQVAAVSGRKDLVQVWSLAGVQVAYAMKSNVFGLQSTPWSLHPFGQRLIKFWFDYYSSIRDIQTLAMLCCAFRCISPSKPLTPTSITSASTPVHPATPKATSNTPTTNYNMYHTIHSTDTSLKGWNYTVRKMRRSNSWSEVTFDGMMNPLSESNVVVDGDSGGNNNLMMMFDNHHHHNNAADDDDNGGESNGKSSDGGLLDVSHGIQYDLFKLSYASILFQWGLVNERAQLLHFLSTQPLDLTSTFCIERVTLSSSSSEKRKEENLTTMTNPISSFSLVCVLCRMKVKGLSAMCLMCGHGGHTLHMMEWFMSHDQCASGCGCECIIANNVPNLSVN